MNDVAITRENIIRFQAMGRHLLLVSGYSEHMWHSCEGGWWSSKEVKRLWSSLWGWLKGEAGAVNLSPRSAVWPLHCELDWCPRPSNRTWWVKVMHCELTGARGAQTIRDERRWYGVRCWCIWLHDKVWLLLVEGCHIKLVDTGESLSKALDWRSL